MRRSPVDPRGVALSVVALLLIGAGLAACAAPSVARGPKSSAPAAAAGPIYTASGGPPVLTSPYTKVMIIAEENEEDQAVIGSPNAPYLTALAHSYGNATNMQAGLSGRLPLARGVHHHHQRRPAGDLRRRLTVGASIVG